MDAQAILWIGTSMSSACTTGLGGEEPQNSQTQASEEELTEGQREQDGATIRQDRIWLRPLIAQTKVTEIWMRKLLNGRGVTSKS